MANPALSKARQLAVLSASHFANDLNGGILPAIYPLLSSRYNLTYAATGYYAAAYLSSSALLQPLFGYLFDRYKTRFLLPLSLLLGALGIGAFGFAEGFEASLLCVALAGTGSALFHPIASAYSSYTSQRRGLLFSIFMVSGRVGAASAPLIAVLATKAWGLRGVAAFTIPTLLILYFTFKVGVYEASTSSGGPVRGLGGVGGGVLLITALVAVAGIGSQVAGSGVASYMSLLSVARGFGEEFGGLLLTVHFVGAVICTPLTGYLSDLKGRHRISILLLLVASTSILILPHVDRAGMLFASAVIGACLVSLFTLLILIMHETLPRYRGVATSIIYGIALGSGGLLTPLVGRVIDLGGFELGYAVLSLIGLGSAIPLAASWLVHRKYGGGYSSRA